MVNASEVSQDELARYYEALGPIRDLVLDDSLTEVMVNGHENVYVERNGKILLTDRKFDDENHLLRVIDFIVSAVGRRIDFRTPMVDARLLDGSRVNAVISPIALDGPMLTIRKFSRDPYQAEDLVNYALRMRPDRIVVGECRAGEALDMLQAMNTGHDGSITTLHANTTRDALSRLETMVLMAGIDLPTKAIRQQVASAIDLIVQLSRMRDGQRKVTSITEITGMEGDTITMQEIFLYESHGMSKEGVMTGVFRPTGIRPHIMDKLFAAGVPIPPELSRVFPDRRASERPGH